MCKTLLDVVVFLLLLLYFSSSFLIVHVSGVGGLVIREKISLKILMFKKRNKEIDLQEQKKLINQVNATSAISSSSDY